MSNHHCCNKDCKVYVDEIEQDNKFLGDELTLAKTRLEWFENLARGTGHTCASYDHALLNEVNRLRTALEGIEQAYKTYESNALSTIRGIARRALAGGMQ